MIFSRSPSSRGSRSSTGRFAPVVGGVSRNESKCRAGRRKSACCRGGNDRRCKVSSAGPMAKIWRNRLSAASGKCNFNRGNYIQSIRTLSWLEHAEGLRRSSRAAGVGLSSASARTRRRVPKTDGSGGRARTGSSRPRRSCCAQIRKRPHCSTSVQTRFASLCRARPEPAADVIADTCLDSFRSAGIEATLT